MGKAGLAVSMGISGASPKGPDEPTFPTLGGELAYLAIKTGVYHSTFGMARQFEESVKRLNIDGVIWGYLYNCRPLALGSHLIKQWIEEKTGVPTLALEIDIYDSRYYSPGITQDKSGSLCRNAESQKSSLQSLKGTTIGALSKRFIKEMRHG